MAKTPEWKRLIDKSQRLWKRYDEKPLKKHLLAFGAHIEKLKDSSSARVKTEARNAVRAFNAELKARGWKKPVANPKKNPKRKTTKRKTTKRKTNPRGKLMATIGVFRVDSAGEDWIYELQVDNEYAEGKLGRQSGISSAVALRKLAQAWEDAGFLE